MNASDIIDGRYRLERLLGTGGMAEVWLAEDQRLQRWVAVKVLRQHDDTLESELAAAFEREATVIARLQHPNIVGVYDAGSYEGRRYIVMEYVHGYTLRQLLETQGRMTEAEAIRYGTQVAAALQLAHSRGIVHCDIKPENVLVNETGVAKVADFGVAETLTRTMAPGQAQDLLGTIAYLAPEIIEGSDPSPASDVYSLALTVFELIAGRPPFSSASAGAALGQRLATPAPPLRTFALGASAELEAVLARALALSPADRFPSASAFASALQRAARPATSQPAAPVAAPPGRLPQSPRRHDTARVRRSQPPAAEPGVSGATILLIVAIISAALVVGVGAALVISNRDNNSGGTATPTPTLEPSPTTAATTEPTAQTTATTTPTASPTRTTTPAATPTPTRTPTRTPTTGASATPGSQTPAPSVSPTAAGTPPAGSPTP